ncbi:MAG: hypothetical protein ABSG83_21660 [Roseiarcus sp.]
MLTKIFVLSCVAVAAACLVLIPDWPSFDLHDHDNLRVVLLGGGLFTIAIAVLIRE